MLGIIGRDLNSHEDRKNFCWVNPDTGERVNLQPWYVFGTKISTKGNPPKETVHKPATQEDFKVFMRIQGDTKVPLVGELPSHIAKVKQEMYDKAVAEYEKKVNTVKVVEK